MEHRWRLLCVLLWSLTAFEVHAQEENIARFGLYVTVADLQKASAFYEQLFQKKPYVRNDALVGFDVAGGLYALYTEQGASGKRVRGDSVVPYLRVKDLEKEFERLKQLGVRLIDEQIVVEGPIKLFKFADPDGNVIEFFSLAAPAPR